MARLCYAGPMTTTASLALDADDLAELHDADEPADDLAEEIDPATPNPLNCDHANPCQDADMWIRVHCYDCGERLARPVHDRCFE